ncbi:hypothetical protein AQJ11_37635 [Streptomyces corchorusii]|uniref:Uncharacterized protein n=1 Tax=Streptomyces corchorusii TaxID=1903 RepID=A0A101PTV7_STRCK|nr:hypothetical protein AQJ11_37635 [Streptomyces corchorusii]
MEALKDLVERILGENDQLPRKDLELTLLIAGLRQHLPHLEQIVTEKDRDLAENVRSLREAPLPVGGVSLVIHTVRLAEMAQALIDRVDAPAPSTRATAPEKPTAGGHTEVSQDALTTAPGGDRPVIGAANVLVSIPGGARTRALQRRSARLEASALASSLQGCGPPAA